MKGVLIRGTAEVPYARRSDKSTQDLLAEAFSRVTQACGVPHDAIDGLGVASFSMRPDKCIDLAWKLGLNTRWSLDDGHGGASGINMLQHAIAAIQSGHASNIVLLAGDAFKASDFSELQANYNVTTRDHLRPLKVANPNTLFAMLTKKHMLKHGLDKSDYGIIPVSQRRWAQDNPLAVYRSPLSLSDYHNARPVAEPLGIYDCVPVVAGANAILLSSEEVVDDKHSCVRVKAIGCNYNFDQQAGDGLSTGIRRIAAKLFETAKLSPADMDLISVYDDYPVMALIQLEDLGIFDPTRIKNFIWDELGSRRKAVNTSGGQLSAGQAGAAGGMHGLTEAIIQLTGKAGERQLPSARRAVVTGYGMVEYRYGMCGNAAILESCQ
jgi:acetyl-CoA acetyltransferase